jgi:hypothetical protein
MISTTTLRAIELKNFKTNGQQESQGEVKISLKY